MMYIEHTPLEDNLQYILRKHDAPAQAVPLADCRHTPNDRHRRSEGGGDFVAPPNAAARLLEIGRCASQKQRSNSRDRDRFPLFAAPPPLEEEEAEEHYELFDVIDSNGDQVEETQNTWQTKFQNQRQPSLTLEHEPSNEIVIEIEPDQDEEYRRKPPALQRINSSSDFSYSQAKAQQHHRVRRPIPDAIPIHLCPSRDQGRSSHNAKSSAPGGIRLLNGRLPIFKRRYSQLSSANSTSSAASVTYSYVEDESVSYFRHNGFVPNANEEESEDEEGAQEIDYNLGQDSQMGIDIIQYVRKLFNLKSNPHYDTQDGKRKRRSNDWAPNTVSPHQIKYRKVENRFPKFIEPTLEDDDLEMISFPHKQERRTIQNIKQKPPALCPVRNSMDTSQRRSLHSIEKPKARNSMFEVPQTTHKLIKNTTFADVEFSDDDDEPIITGYGGRANASSLSATGGVTAMGGGIKKPLRQGAFNIPISHRSEERLSAKPQPPPLIEARTGSILASSLVPELDTIRKPSYTETLRQSNKLAMGGGHVLGGQPSSSISSSVASTSASAREFNWFGNIRTNSWSTNARTILAQENETKDREKYQQLLEQMVPRIYGITNSATPQLLANKSAQHLGGQQRRSGYHLAAARSNSPFVNHKKSDTKLKRPPLSSTTINLDIDEDDVDDDVTIMGVSHLKRRPSLNKKESTSTALIIDDDDISDIIDLGDQERSVLSACAKLKVDSEIILDESKMENKQKKELPYVTPVNTLHERLSTSTHMKAGWLEKWQSDRNQKYSNRQREVYETVKVADKLTAERQAAEIEREIERLSKFQIIDPDYLVIDDFLEPEEEEEPEFIELTGDFQARIKAAICGPPDQVLVSKFNLNITRRDIHTLLGHSWLNDEVINFYMNLLTERGDKKHESHGLPRVYAMNTFFVPRLLQAGHSGVKRWTRKVDIFEKDVIPVPVHVGGVHWCMAIIHMKNRTIKYYDSMGTPNPSVLKALEQYLRDESMDKRKQSFDTSQFEIESVRDVPRQMNGSDCGVFSCMFAEYITRSREITFSQQNMEYFRHKMILEIVRGELLH